MISRFLTQRNPKVSFKPPASDPQIAKIYTLERYLVGSWIDCVTPLDKLQGIVRYVCKELKIERPTVRLAGEAGVCSRCFGWTTGTTIYLNEHFHGQNLGVLLHELAHHACWELYDENVDDHGGEFIGVYRYLLDRLNVLPKVAFDALLDAFEIDCEVYEPETTDG